MIFQNLKRTPARIVPLIKDHAHFEHLKQTSVQLLHSPAATFPLFRPISGAAPREDSEDLTSNTSRAFRRRLEVADQSTQLCWSSPRFKRFHLHVRRAQTKTATCSHKSCPLWCLHPQSTPVSWPVPLSQRGLIIYRTAVVPLPAPGARSC